VLEVFSATPIGAHISFILFDPLTQSLLLGTIALIAIGFLMAPAALRLIQSSQSEPISPSTKMQARIFAAVAVAATIVIGYTLPVVERSFYSDFSAHWRILSPILSIIGSLIATIPYVALSIVLSLLATNEPQEPAIIPENPAETE
jgi:hypothetical protein